MIKIGIIGCGKITEVRHAPEYMENPNCELAAFYDLVPARAEEFARRFGGRAYGSVDELLARLMTFPNVLVTSHMGFFTKEAMQAIAIETLENAYMLEQGLPLVNEVKADA